MKKSKEQNSERRPSAEVPNKELLTNNTHPRPERDKPEMGIDRVCRWLKKLEGESGKRLRVADETRKKQPISPRGYSGEKCTQGKRQENPEKKK